MANILKLGDPLKLVSLASDPSSPVAGELYYNTGANAIRYYNGTTFLTIGSGSGTVTSVDVQPAAGATTNLFTSSGGPVTTSGTITLTLASQSANSVFAAPDGSSGAPSFRALVNADLPIVAATKGGTGQSSYTTGDVLYASSSTALSKLGIGTTGQVLTVSGGGIPSWATPTTGTVTSVALADASTTAIYSVSGSPVTSSGTLTLTLVNQSANTVFAGPASGGATQPGFRSLVADDIPSLSGIYATISLNNLSSTAINADLIPDTDIDYDLGSSSNAWQNLYVRSVQGSNDPLLLTTTVPDGAVTIRPDGIGYITLQAEVVAQGNQPIPTGFIEDQYYHSFTLAANTSSFTDITGFTYDGTLYHGAIIEYSIIEATTNAVRVGKMMVANNDGNSPSSADQYAETAVLGTPLMLQAVQSGGVIQIQFAGTSASNACTMRARITRFAA